MPVTVSDNIVRRKVFNCSDGRTFTDARNAFRHEMYVRIQEIFPQSVIEYSKTFKGKRYHLCKHMFIRCGIYHIILRDKEDMSAMNHFFRGLRGQLDYPDENEYPIEFDLEIFYEDVPGAIMGFAQWKIYGEDIIRHGTENYGDGENG